MNGDACWAQETTVFMYTHDDREDAHRHGYIYNNTKIAVFFECWSCKTIVLRIGNTNLYNKSTVKRNVKHTSQKSGMATKCCRGYRNDKKQSSKMSKRPRVIAAGVTLFIHLFIYVFVYFIYLLIYLCVYSFMYLFVCSCIYLFIELFACLFIYLFICLFIQFF